MEPKNTEKLKLARTILVYLSALRLNWGILENLCVCQYHSLTPWFSPPPSEFVAQIKIIGGRNPPPWEYRLCLPQLQNTSKELAGLIQKSFWSRTNMKKYLVWQEWIAWWQNYFGEYRLCLPQLQNTPELMQKSCWSRTKLSTGKMYNISGLQNFALYVEKLLWYIPGIWTRRREVWPWTNFHQYWNVLCPNRTMCLFDILAHSTKGKYFKSYLKKYICKNSQNTWANGDICLFVDFTRNVLYTFEEVSYINWILLATVLHICLTYNIKVT